MKTSRYFFLISASRYSTIYFAGILYKNGEKEKEDEENEKHLS